MNFPIIISIKSISLSKQEKNFISKIKPFGVIIFARNIINIPQISKLNQSIKSLSKNTLIFIDQEGGIVNRFKKEKFAAIRQAKLRLSNIKLEEITQVLRNKSKWIKH